MALTTGRDTLARDDVVYAYTVATGQTIYAGALVALNAAGAAIPAVAGGGLTVVGRAEHKATAGQTVRVRRGAFLWDNAAGGGAIGAGDVGKTAYAESDHSVSKTSSGRSAVGTIRAVTPEGVWVAT